MSAGLLRRVTVDSVPNSVRKKGDAKSKERFGNRMAGWTCEDNAHCLAKAMTESGEDDWKPVFGFAFGSDPFRPVAHVWVRKGEEHFDPTWSIIKSIKKCRYFALTGDNATTISSLGGLERLASEWRLELSDGLNPEKIDE